MSPDLWLRVVCDEILITAYLISFSPEEAEGKKEHREHFQTIPMILHSFLESERENHRG